MYLVRLVCQYFLRTSRITSASMTASRIYAFSPFPIYELVIKCLRTNHAIASPGNMRTNIRVRGTGGHVLMIIRSKRLLPTEFLVNCHLMYTGIEERKLQDDGA